MHGTGTSGQSRELVTMMSSHQKHQVARRPQKPWKPSFEESGQVPHVQLSAISHWADRDQQLTPPNHVVMVNYHVETVRRRQTWAVGTERNQSQRRLLSPPEPRHIGIQKPLQKRPQNSITCNLLRVPACVKPHQKKNSLTIPNVSMTTNRETMVIEAKQLDLNFKIELHRKCNLQSFAGLARKARMKTFQPNMNKVKSLNKISSNL